MLPKTQNLLVLGGQSWSKIRHTACVLALDILCKVNGHTGDCDRAL